MDRGSPTIGRLVLLAALMAGFTTAGAVTALAGAPSVEPSKRVPEGRVMRPDDPRSGPVRVKPTARTVVEGPRLQMTGMGGERRIEGPRLRMTGTGS